MGFHYGDKHVELVFEVHGHVHLVLERVSRSLGQNNKSYLSSKEANIIENNAASVWIDDEYLEMVKNATVDKHAMVITLMFTKWYLTTIELKIGPTMSMLVAC